MPRGHRLDGNVLRDTDNQRASKVRRAGRDRCPKCDRKAALRTYYVEGVGLIEDCRWTDQGKCDHGRVISQE